MPFDPRAWPYGSRLPRHRTGLLPGSLNGQHHRRFGGCLSGPTAWLSPGPLAERVFSSNWGHSTVEIGTPPRPEGRGFRSGRVL